MKSEPHYLLKLLHLQNQEFRHPPCWSQSLLLPLLGRRFPPAPSFDRGAPSTLCAISLFVGRSSVNFAGIQVGCCGFSSHHFLAGSKLTCPIFSCTCLAKLRWDEPDYTHHLSLHLAAGHCWRKGPQPRTLVSLRALDHQPQGGSFCWRSHHASVICLHSSLRKNFSDIFCHFLQPQICPTSPSLTLVFIFVS